MPDRDTQVILEHLAEVDRLLEKAGFSLARARLAMTVDAIPGLESLDILHAETGATVS
jgi:hypothetical protein